MGDIPPSTALRTEDGAPSPFPGTTSPAGQSLQHPQSQHSAYQSAGYSSLPLQHYSNPQHAFSSQLEVQMAQSQASGRGGPYNMNAMANALPQQTYRTGQYPQSQQRFSPTNASTSAMPNQMALQQQQYEGHAGLNPLATQPYYLPHPSAMPQYYSHMSPQPMPANVASRNNTGYYPSPVLMNQQASAPSPYYYPQASHYNTQAHGMTSQMVSAQYLSSTPPHVDPRMAAASPADQYGTSPYSQNRGSISPENHSNIVRGPPRKPRQSGHAIWIGNLPPQTDLMSLVNHVCKQAAGLESLFLISKSNCAFANFKDESTCVAAQQKLHDSKFQTVRLVSRLRKNTVEGATGITAPTGPSAVVSQPTVTEDASAPVDTALEAKEVVAAPSTTDETNPVTSEPASAEGGLVIKPVQKERFFILKSLTMEDLDLSVRTGTWATQAHNEKVLNDAFATSENVYLVFSANKSGEYFGYARMTSPINDDPSAAIEFAPKAQTADDIELPKAIPTEANEFAPEGRIIDDSARGTIFWEAKREESTAEVGGQDAEEGSNSPQGSAGDTGSVQSDGTKGETKAWGKPFKLEWQATIKLPFYRTRGLRNPWNSNREVKIARDGTELEPQVGRRLIGLFSSRVQSPAPPVSGIPGVLGGAIPMMVPGYPNMRAPYQL